MDGIENLPEGFIFNTFTPAGVVSLDERGLIQAVLAGYEDRVCDLRALTGKLSEFFSPLGAQDYGANVVLVQAQTSQGKLYTRSLDIVSSTPPSNASSTVLIAWAAQQMGVDVSTVTSAAYGVDVLRLVSMDTLGYLADTIGAILYQSAITDALPAVVGASGTISATQLSRQTLLATYFPRLQSKGTAQSFDSLGRVLGWDDVVVTPLWSRLSPRIPNDPGNPQNTADFSPAPDFYPQAQTSVVYDPTNMLDGPFFTWTGTVSPGTSDTSFYTQAINGFQPWVTVKVTGTANQYGSIAHPSSGSYVLQGGAPYTYATASAGTSPLTFTAIADGASFNGVAVDVFLVQNGSLRGISISSRLSSKKFRSSFFDVDLGIGYDKAQQVFGTEVVRTNTDISSAKQIVSFNGSVLPAISPYRPFSAGTVIVNGTAWDYLMPMVGQVTVLQDRTQAGATQYQQDTQALQSAALHGVQAMEEVRAATRTVRNANAGYSFKDSAGYAPYDSLTLLFTTAGTQSSYSGVAANFPLVPYAAQFYTTSPSIQFSGEQSQSNPDMTVYAGLNQQITGTYFNSTGSYSWNLYAGAPGGMNFYAAWVPTSTEVIRPEPTYSDKQTGTVVAQARPEDQTDDTLIPEVLDEYPWRRDLTAGGDLIDLDFYTPTVPDATVEVLDTATAVEDQSGVQWNVYAVNSTQPLPRIVKEQRDAFEYVPAQIAVAYTGAFRNLALYTGNQTQYFIDADDLTNTRTTFSRTDYDALFSGTYGLYHAGLVDNVLVADPVKFNSQSHRNNLQGWLTCNEHPDDDLVINDNGNPLTQQILYGIQPSSRVYDAQRGLVLYVPINGGFDSNGCRYLSNSLSASFWVMPDVVNASVGSATLFSYGPLSVLLPDASNTATVYSILGTTAQVVGTLVLTAGAWNQIQLIWTPSSVQFGVGSMSSAAVLTTVVIASSVFAQTDQTLSMRVQARACKVHDYRIWNAVKLLTDLEAVRSYGPNPTLAQYRLGQIYTANRFDRYGLTVLSNGFLAPAGLPPWMEAPKYARVSRYTSLGNYQGDSRYKEVGAGGGQIPPSSWQLGNQFFNVTAAGTFVVSTQQGAMPGWDAYWARDTVSGTYYKTTGSNSSGSIVAQFASGSGSSPWPNYMEATNLVRDRIWVQGDTGVVYEVMLQAQALGIPVFVANPIARNRTQAELQVTGALTVLPTTGSVYMVSKYGTIYPAQLQVTAGTSVAVDDGNGNLIPNGNVTGGILVPSTGAITVLSAGAQQVSILMPAAFTTAEQPTGAEVLVATPGTRVSVSAAGSVYQTAYAGTVTTPSVYLYLNNQVAAQASGAALLAQWVDVNNFGLGLGIPALSSAGEITLQPPGGLQAGTYRLTVNSGNIGQVDSSFEGFKVQITIGATVIDEVLLAGFTGANFQGQNVFEFQVKDAIPNISSNNWLLIFNWSNDLADPARGVIRQFALYGYTLEYVATQVWQMAVSSVSVTPTLTQMSQTMPPFGPGSAPGGWYSTYNSYGSSVTWQHESLAYPGNDTLISITPESDQLTGRTGEKREDVIITATGSGTNGYYFLLPDASVPAFNGFGTGFTIA